MRRLLTHTLFVLIGIGLTVLAFKFLDSEPYDLQIYRGKNYEVWVSNKADFPVLPMSAYRYVVKYREICADSGNICSQWKVVADFLLDDPYPAASWKFSEHNLDLEIEFPQKIKVLRVGNIWRTEGNE